MADEPKLIVMEDIPEPQPVIDPPVEVNTKETAQEAYAKLGIPRMAPLGKKSPIKAAYDLENHRVMVLTEDGNRIWFTPGVIEGNEELQTDYEEFMKKGN